jgi:hypothetical protein
LKPGQDDDDEDDEDANPSTDDDGMSFFLLDSFFWSLALLVPTFLSPSCFTSYLIPFGMGDDEKC